MTALLVGLACAAPVSEEDAACVARTFVAGQAPALNAVTAKAMPAGDAAVRVVRIGSAGATVGFVAEFASSGFVVMRADDRLPALKLYAAQGTFASLPPAMQRVLTWELEQEARALASQQVEVVAQRVRNQAEWQALRQAHCVSNAAPRVSTAGWSDLPLLQTAWNQDAPYNADAPSAAGGPDSKAYAGCVACAMAQILKHHAFPPAPARDFGYCDHDGACRGQHRASEAGLLPYAWDGMSDRLTKASGAGTIAETARLMYHCGVSVNMDYEGTGSGAFSRKVPNALRRQFGYSCSDLRMRGNYFDQEWYDMLAWDVQNNRVVFYGFYNDRGEGHAVVCDGVRDGNQVHINMGWSGCEDAWYFLNGIGEWRNYHHAIFDIRPARVTQPPALPTVLCASVDEHARLVVVTWQAQTLATTYQLFRSLTNDPAGAVLLGTTSFPLFHDARVSDGQTYYYWLRAGNGAGWSALSPVAAGRSSAVGGAVFTPPLQRTVRACKIGYQLNAQLHMTWAELSACITAGYNKFALNFSDGTVQQVTLQADARGTAFFGALAGATPTRVSIRATR
ncbi:MAG: C10 family peptidase, partial [bacterium]|nr:C10 family peptidase [bacterium]